jgi:thioredoxin
MKKHLNKSLLLTGALLLTSYLVLTSCGVNSNKNDKKSDESSAGANTEKVSNTIHLTRAAFLEKVYNFEKSPDKWVYAGDKPAIIDFYADWCGPCKQVAPIMEELANEYKGKIYIYKIDTDAEPQLAQEFGISAIPSILFVPMNEKPQMSQGAMSKAQLKDAIQRILKVQ